MLEGGLSFAHGLLSLGDPAGVKRNSRLEFAPVVAGSFWQLRSVVELVVESVKLGLSVAQSILIFSARVLGFAQCGLRRTVGGAGVVCVGVVQRVLLAIRDSAALCALQRPLGRTM